MNPEPTPAFIPHEEFHKGSWLLSVERPGWYYFWEKENQNDITNPGFSDTVDEPLRDLVTFLHGKGIKTTPSCAGHHINGKNFEKIYAGLEIDKAAIRNGGLQLQDIESGKIYAFRDEEYLLPWKKEDFLRRAMTYQEDGIIGIRADGVAKERLLSLCIPNVKIQEKDSIVLIRTLNDGSNIHDKWKHVTNKVMNVFNMIPAESRAAYRPMYSSS